VDPSIKILNDYFSEKVFRTAFPNEKAKAVGCNAMFTIWVIQTALFKVKNILDAGGVWCIQLRLPSLMIDNVNF